MNNNDLELSGDTFTNEAKIHRDFNRAGLYASVETSGIFHLTASSGGYLFIQ